MDRNHNFVKDNLETPRSGRATRTVAALALSGALVGGLAGCNEDKASADTQQPLVETSKTPMAVEEPVKDSEQPADDKINKEAVTTSNFEPMIFKADKYVNSEGEVDADALAKAYIASLNDIYNTVTDPKEVQSLIGIETMNKPTFVKLNAAADEKWANANLVSDWKERPELVQWFESLQNSHGFTSWANWATTDSGEEEDIEPYRQTMRTTEVDVVSSSAEEVTVKVRLQFQDNSELNRGEKFFTDDQNDDTGGESITFVREGSQWKVKTASYYAG